MQPEPTPPDRTARLRLALVAHDAKKDALAAWAERHAAVLLRARLYATGATGARLRQVLPGLELQVFKSGPLGGDQQLGALISEGLLDALIFFVDPMSPMPHDVDIKALNRIAVVYDLPLANSPRTADLVLQGLAPPAGAPGGA